MKTYCFGEHQFIPERQLLLHGTTPVRIGGRAADILAALVERPGQVLTKDELMARAWPGLVVEPANLKVNVAAIRKALGGEAGERSIIAVNGRGYRFAVPVEAWTATPPTALRKPSLPVGPPLIGRAEAAAHITRLLGQHRLVTIIGTGGVGKTSLAIHVANLAAEGYRHGAWLLDFGIISDPACIAGALAAELGVTVQADDILAALAQALRDWQALLVFDCCEQALEETARIATRLLDAAPGLGILATSREALRARQERVYVLPPLELPPYSACRTAEKARAFPAIQLFLERAAARAGGFSLDDSNVAEICAICRTLDGVPWR
ncbi:ATP-binding protein [Dankookia sp. P2]|uniref:ATP-binding protein n=1 Tax=Dankookia sp. P2 TaxID=3423955 RepID=UPI003D67D6BA